MCGTGLSLPPVSCGSSASQASPSRQSSPKEMVPPEEKVPPTTPVKHPLDMLLELAKTGDAAQAPSRSCFRNLKATARPPRAPQASPLL